MAETKQTGTGTHSHQEERDRTGAPAGEGSARRPQRDQTMARQGSYPQVFASSPFDFMRRMNEEMDRVFDRLFEDFGGARRSMAPRGYSGGFPAATGTVWSPRIEAFQQEDRFVVRAELPGLKKDDIEVNVTDDAITIQGQRTHEHEDQREGYFHSERSYGRFYRAIPLPDGVIADSAQASFRDGILEVTLQAPPHEVRSGRRLEIKEGGEPGKQK